MIDKSENKSTPPEGALVRVNLPDETTITAVYQGLIGLVHHFEPNTFTGEYTYIYVQFVNGHIRWFYKEELELVDCELAKELYL